MECPLLIYDRNIIKNDRYLFISYSHEDNDTVYEILTKLYDSGVNYWYDKGLEPGDIWDKDVKKNLESPKCVGAYIFLSKQSIKSDSVSKEINIILDRVAKQDGFFIFPILIDSPSLNHLYADVYLTFDDSSAEVSDAIISRIKELTSNNKRIYYSHEDTEHTVQALLDMAAKASATEQNNIEIKKNEISILEGAWEKGGDYYFEAGKYYFSKDGDNQPIAWKLIKKEVNNFVFASVYALDFVERDKISDLICKIRKSLAQKPYTQRIDLISKSELTQCKDLLGRFIPTDYADSNRTQLLRLFWVASDDNGKLLYNSDGVYVDKSINQEMIKCGVRLVLTINTDV